MSSARVSVWMLHAKSIDAAAIDTATGEFFKDTVVAKPVVIEWIRGMRGPAAVAYETGPTGFGPGRALREVGLRCEVAAPIATVAACW